nr:MAG TPA: hypothetical protein [Caudoviricetes sp.]
MNNVVNVFRFRSHINRKPVDLSRSPRRWAGHCFGPKTSMVRQSGSKAATSLLRLPIFPMSRNEEIPLFTTAAVTKF